MEFRLRLDQSLKEPFLLDMVTRMNYLAGETRKGRSKTKEWGIASPRTTRGFDPQKHRRRFRSSHRLFGCTLSCSEYFVTIVNVKTHFVKCVQKDGNPDGVFWDDPHKFLKNEIQIFAPVQGETLDKLLWISELSRW